MRLIALVNLKPGILVETYEAWARNVDLPTVNGLPSVEDFSIHRITGQMGSDVQSPYSYIEVIDVADMDRFGKDISTAAMQAIAADFAKMADFTFLTTEELTA